MIAVKTSLFDRLICSVCHRPFDPDVAQTFAQCESCGNSPLLAEYDLFKAQPTDFIKKETPTMWRYFDLLPVKNPANIVSLGEGWTPISSLNNIALKLEIENLLMKDESLNPTGSFKARGMSAAVSKAKELGISKAIVPTAGNAGVALSAYCAKAGLECLVLMPSITPKIFVDECQFYGNEVILVDGLIDACAKKASEINSRKEYFNFSTMKEPYRLEGKKTLGYEIAEQLNWTLPDVILYPTGGGTGLIGIWKAFHEMMEMGWISGPLPRMIAVQSDSCQPVVHAFNSQPPTTSSNGKKSSVAYGLNVPNPFALRLILQVLNDSNGQAIAVSEQQLLNATREVAKEEGFLIAPEGGALLAALKVLLDEKKIAGSERVLLLNTGSGVKYLPDLV